MKAHTKQRTRKAYTTPATPTHHAPSQCVIYSLDRSKEAASVVTDKPQDQKADAETRTSPRPELHEPEQQGHAKDPPAQT